MSYDPNAFVNVVCSGFDTRISTVEAALAAAVPPAPTLTVTPGDGKNTLAWTDGPSGTPITGHKLYESSVSGTMVLIGTISTASPFVDAGLTNGQARFYRLSAVNTAGEGALSPEKSGVPQPKVTITGTPPSASQNVAYTFMPTTSGGSGTKTFALTGTLPTGLSFSTTTGTISGTPTVVGTTSGLNITVTDNSGQATLGAFSLVVGSGFSAGTARVVPYADDFETPGTISGRPNWTLADATQTANFRVDNGYAHLHSNYDQNTRVLIGPAGTDFVATVGYDTSGTGGGGQAWDEGRQTFLLWYVDSGNYIEAAINKSIGRLVISGQKAGTSIGQLRFNNVTWQLVGEITIQSIKGKIRVKVDGKWLIDSNAFTYPFDVLDLSTQMSTTLPAGKFGLSAQTWTYAQAQYIALEPLAVSIDYNDVFVGRNVAGGTNGDCLVEMSYTAVSTPVSWVYRLKDQTTKAVVQDWSAMKTPTASNGLCSALATLPVGGPYEIEAGYVDASGTRYTATSRGASCGMLGMTWGQSNSGGRNSGWTTPTYSAMAFSGQQYPDSPQGGTPLREWASAYNTKIIPQASYATAYVMSQALGIPVGISAVGVASRTLQSLSPGGADWVSFTNAVGYHRGVVEFVVWDQGEADADGAAAPTGYSASFRGNLLPGLRTATNNPNLKVFIAPVGRFAASTPPSSPNYPAAQIDAQREVLRQQYLDIIANEPLVQFSASKLGCVHGDSYHYSTSNTGYPEMSRRDGFTIAKAFGAAVHDGKGPTVASASRSGAVITLTMAMGGATGLTGPTTLATGTVPTPTLGNALYGFQVSKDGFATTLPISTITISGNSLVITLAADPGAAVSIRSCYGWSYDDTNLIYGTYADTTPIPVFPVMTPLVAA